MAHPITIRARKARAILAAAERASIQDRWAAELRLYRSALRAFERVPATGQTRRYIADMIEIAEFKTTAHANGWA